MTRLATFFYLGTAHIVKILWTRDAESCRDRISVCSCCTNKELTDIATLTDFHYFNCTIQMQHLFFIHLLLYLSLLLYVCQATSLWIFPFSILYRIMLMEKGEKRFIHSSVHISNSVVCHIFKRSIHNTPFLSIVQY